MNSRGRSLELFFVDGNPDGMLTAELFNWTGHVLRIPRTRLAEGLSRPEAKQTGVYLLVGEDEDGQVAYIGETENMSVRLSQHAREKGWWNIAVLITTHGDALHKAHVKFLESKLVEHAKAAGASRLENGNAPSGASLNEAATANMESFLDTLHMILPAIKIDIFRSGRRSIDSLAESALLQENPEFVLRLAKHNLEARAVLVDQEMVVKAGSQIRSQWVGDRSQKIHYWKIYDELWSSGVAVLDGDVAKFSEDYAFSSPSAAASVITGRSANGRTSWKTLSGETYAEWEISRITEERNQ